MFFVSRSSTNAANQWEHDGRMRIRRYRAAPRLWSHTLSLGVTGPTFADQAAEDLSQRSDFILCQSLGHWQREMGLSCARLRLLLTAAGLYSHVSAEARWASILHLSPTTACLDHRRVNEVIQWISARELHSISWYEASLKLHIVVF